MGVRDLLQSKKKNVAEHWKPAEEYRRHDPDGSLYGGKVLVTELQVTVRPDGSLDGVTINRSSGLDFLDDTAVEAFENAQPLGEPPCKLNEGALESALIAAENRAWYENADLVGCAAAYAFHLTSAHAFVDGNKRVAAAATEVFVLVDGAEINASDDELYELFIGIASGTLSREQVEGWLRGRMTGKARS